LKIVKKSINLKNTPMKNYILSLLFVFGIFTGIQAQYQEEMSPNDALLHIYHLRSAGANIVKDYVFNSLNVKYVKSNIDKILSKAEIDQLNIGIFAKEHPYLQEPVEKLVSLRLKGRMLILKQPEKERVKKMKMVFDKLLQLSNKIATTIKEHENIKNNTMLAAANQLDVTGQKLAIYYALKHLFPGYVTNMELEQISNEFRQSLAILFNDKNQNSQQTQLIKNIQADWAMLEKLLKKKDTNMINIVYMLSNKITRNSQKLGNSYMQ
jgi:hypothetical protein